MPTPRILAFSGSARRESFNQRLVTVAAASAEASGADVTLINLRDFPMPLYNQDDEAESGQPDSVRELKGLFAKHHGLLIASPEYNGLPTPLLKNTLDWLSRKHDDEASMMAYTGKVAAIMGASGGSLGGLRGLVHLRALLNNMGVVVQPKQHALSGAHKAFDDEGELVNERDQSSIDSLANGLVDLCRKLHA
ncbi:MAG: NAD(P)H-dependent oxidoreductase [Woeseiaceae bacterium]|nr:NAD(P)H-dependent oxidoreductase [Woeseiaceae bacterium]